MNKEIKLVASQVNKFNQVKNDGYGCLIGAEDNEVCVILGFSVLPCDTSCDTIDHELLHLQTNLPAGIELLGIVVFGDKNEVDESLIQPVEKFIGRHPLIAYVKIGNAEDLKVFHVVYNKKSQKAFQLIDDQDVWKRFIHIRIKSNVPFICDMSLEGVKEAFALWSKKISAGCLAFTNIKSDVYMTFEEQTGEYKTVGDIFEVTSETDSLDSKPKRQSNVRKVDILPMELLLKAVRDIRTPSQERSAPVLQYIKKHYECLKGHLYIDSLCMVGRKMLVDSELYSILVEAVRKSLKLYEECFVQLLTQNMGNFSLPMPYHFLPPNFMHFISLVYPKSSKAEDFLQMRSLLHQKFCLPEDRPFFRPTNSYIFREDIPKSAPLLNTHEGLGPSGVKGGEFALVQGLYSYHHYMQDRMDDNGWGCAYRSLQTVASWFRWQGYTDKPVPTHKEIQQCLVSIGDKPASFVGSKEWIGSTEVSFCLETMLGVTSRILTASSGEEMASCGSQLLEHFKIHGTPIMIGGGVLAHTILGVHYCSESGQIKFLILDPHYTGGEDLHVIQSKGWCGWKGLDFWAKGAFYNLCMPLRPICI